MEKENGKFLDHTGTLLILFFVIWTYILGDAVIAYYHSQLLPLPIIRHCNCTFVPREVTRWQSCDEYRQIDISVRLNREGDRERENKALMSTQNYEYLYTMYINFRSSLHSFASWERKRTLESTTSASSSVYYWSLTSPKKRARLESTKKKTKALRMH